MPIPIKVSLERPVFHTSFKAKCNGKQYLIPIPHTNFNFIEITSDITFSNQYEKYLAVLSGTVNEVESIDQYYQFQEFSHKYFNIKVQMNWDDLALKILADKDSIFMELDRMHFKDLLIVFKKAYNAFADKLHSKVNRRLKSYIKATNRTENEKNQISQLITLIKADSTEEQFSDNQKKPISIKPAKKYNQKQKPFAKKVEKVEPIQQKSVQKKVEPQKQESAITEAKQSVQNEDHEHTHQAKINKKEHPNFYKTIHHQKRHKNRDYSKKEEDDQNDWEDIKTEKINKRKDKNLKKKHQKYDLNSQNLSNEAEEDEEEELIQAQVQRQQKKPRKKYVKEDNRGNYQPKTLFSNSKEKPKKQMRILLGINGDNDDGWRERYRVARSPIKTQNKPEKQEAKKYKEKSKEKENSPQPKIDIQNSLQTVSQTQNVAAESKVIRLESGSKQLVKIFSYPKDGNKFILDASKQYKLYVNNNFWVMLQKDKMTVQKQDKGYLRDCKFRSSDDYLLEAQDLTLTLNGMSNLEDGGTQFNNPIVQDFIGPSQWFKVTQMQIYAYE